MISELVAFAGGVLFGTAGVKALGSKDAKKHMLTLRLLV